MALERDRMRREVHYFRDLTPTLTLTLTLTPPPTPTPTPTLTLTQVQYFRDVAAALGEPDAARFLPRTYHFYP